MFSPLEKQILANTCSECLAITNRPPSTPMCYGEKYHFHGTHRKVIGTLGTNISKDWNSILNL